MTFGEAGPVPAQGQIAQQIFWYTAFTADMTKPGLPVVNADGTPKWRMAPGAERPVLEAGHAERLPGRRLVDLLRATTTRTARRRPGCTRSSSPSKTTSLKKSIVGLTFIRDSDIRHELLHQERAPSTAA